MSLGIALLAILVVLLILALIFSTAQKYVTSWLFKRDLPWRPLFWVTLSVGAVYAVASSALAFVLAAYATFLTAPLGVVLHAALVRKYVPDANGTPLRLRQAIFGQALTILSFVAQHSPFFFNMLRGSS